MMIRCESDLRRAYEAVIIIKKILPTLKRKDVAVSYIKDLKKDIREYLRGEAQKPQRRLVKDNGIDGYIVLMELPAFLDNKEIATMYFEEHEVLTCRPSLYDCTGQAFTSWYKVVERNGKQWAYHSICFDV